MPSLGEKVRIVLCNSSLMVAAKALEQQKKKLQREGSKCTVVSQSKSTVSETQSSRQGVVGSAVQTG